MALMEHVLARLIGEPGTENTEALQELCCLASDRICLRVREPTLPVLLETIAADTVVKLWRRWNYEGISSENNGISTSFVEDILAEYSEEFDAYMEMRDESRKKTVRFL